MRQNRRMMPDEHGVGDTGADLDRAARNQMVAGLRIGSVIQGAAVLLFVFTAALRLDGCDFRDSMAGASFVAIGFDVVAALVALGWMSRSRHRGRAVVAGLAL